MVYSKCSHIHVYSSITEVAQAEILAVADEEGSLRLLDIKKSASQSLVKGRGQYTCMYMYM